MGMERSIKNSDGALLRESFAFGQRIRREAHRHPELSGRETRTSSLLQQELRELGYSVAVLDGSPSFLAFNSACAHFALGLRAELDALPIQENPNEKEVVSEHAGIMHACGHDMHMGIACAFAYYLAKADRGTTNSSGVLFIFESSEESLPGGAQAILESEVFKARRPSTMFAFHCDPAWPVGSLASKPGEYMASGDELHFTVRGQGGHGALPQEHDDPLLAGAHLVIAMQSMMTRTVPADIPAVLSVGRFEALGATNVIPDVATLQGTFRAHNEAWRAVVKKNIRAVAQGIGDAFHVDIETRIVEGYPTLINSPELYERASVVSEELTPSVRFERVGLRMTTDDFAYFAQAIPSLYVRLGVGTDGGKLHTATFCPDEEAIGVALEWLLAYYRSLAKG